VAGPLSSAARWLGAFPREEVQAGRSWWRRAGEAVLGLEPGSAPEPLLSRPFGVAVDGDDLLVADPDGAQVLLVAWRSGEHRPLTCAARPWATPMAVAVGADRSRWVADAAGVLVRVEDGGRCAVLGAGLLVRPTGVACLGDLTWVVDPPAHALVAFGPDGRVRHRVGGTGEGAGTLHFPSAVAASPDGTLLVVDALNLRLLRFAADGSPRPAPAGDELGALGRLKGVAVGAGGLVLVTDDLTDQVLVLDRDGRPGRAFGGSGGGAGQLLLPAGLAVDGRRVFVSDSANRRIAIFELLEAA
jgi:sugar lactone lactonase YvrE